jgi:hypothetical protein
MKKLVLTMIAMVTMSLSAMAQDTAQVRRQFNPEQMAKMRTDAVVKKYGLNDDQAKKLLDLNTRFAGRFALWARWEASAAVDSVCRATDLRE